jgi:hypothetical protein
MIKNIKYSIVLAMFIMLAASCQKEVVKPCNPADSNNIYVPVRGGDDLPTDPNGSGSGSGDGGITDGGGSSENDQKGKPKK